MSTQVGDTTTFVGELRKLVDKDRVGTHWVGCEKSHKDCAILKAADYIEALEKDFDVMRHAKQDRIDVLEKRLEAAERMAIDCEDHGEQKFAECPMCYDELSKRLEEAEKVVVAAQALMVEWTMGLDKVPTTETRAEDALAQAVAALAKEEK